MRLVMGRMMKNWKLIMGCLGLVAIGMLMACGPEYKEAFDPEEQLEIDIELIEEYLADQGYTQYDTIENDIRVLVLEEGDGAAINYNDIVSFHYTGRYLDGTIFDTSNESMAIAQDLEYLNDTTFMTEKDDVTPVLDDEGNKIVRQINYLEGYVPVYFDGAIYEPYITTHVPGGWYTDVLYPRTNITPSGFAAFPRVVTYALEEANINGHVRAILPSSQAFGNISLRAVERFRNTVLILDIYPVEKK